MHFVEQTDSHVLSLGPGFRAHLNQQRDVTYRVMAEQTTVAAATDSPLKRPREGDENGAAAFETNANISSVIPGWFSEISPMWPGGFSFISHFLTVFICMKVFILGFRFQIVYRAPLFFNLRNSLMFVSFQWFSIVWVFRISW